MVRRILIEHHAAIGDTICDLLISVDTGLIHLASAVGTPCVGLYGPIYPELRMHPGLGRAVISAEAQCRGCFHWYDGDVENCPKGHHECMRLIGVESVVWAVNKILSSRSEFLGFRGSFFRLILSLNIWCTIFIHLFFFSGEIAYLQGFTLTARNLLSFDNDTTAECSRSRN